MRQLIDSQALSFLAATLGAELPLATIRVFQWNRKLFWFQILPGWKFLVLVRVLFSLFRVRFILVRSFVLLLFLRTVFDQVWALTLEALGFVGRLAGIVTLWQLGCQGGPFAIRQKAPIGIIYTANECQPYNEYSGSEIREFVLMLHCHHEIEKTMNFPIEILAPSLRQLVEHVRTSADR